MALVPYLTKDKMSGKNRAFAEKFEQKHGRPPWLRMLGAHYPPFLDAVDALYPHFMEHGTIDRQTKELMFVASSEVRACQWCVGSHSRYLVHEGGMTQEQVERSRRGEDETTLSDQQKLLIQFARCVAKDPKRIQQKDIDQLRSASLNDSQIVEAIAVVAMSAFTNTFTDTLKMADDLEMMGLQNEFF
ncbi:MAG: peroxidase-related enzyme [Gammaproteobacteria bacterium]|nr:peroxidase-related enzyme [Gammaproteobacteria bacterium]